MQLLYVLFHLQNRINVLLTQPWKPLIACGRAVSMAAALLGDANVYAAPLQDPQNELVIKRQGFNLSLYNTQHLDEFTLITKNT